MAGGPFMSSSGMELEFVTRSAGWWVWFAGGIKNSNIQAMDIVVRLTCALLVRTGGFQSVSGEEAVGKHGSGRRRPFIRVLLVVPARSCVAGL